MSAEAKERPILFSGEMVQALLAGRKTQTRRVIKPQPTGWNPSPGGDEKPWAGAFWWCVAGDMDYSEKRVCPYGNPSDRLWVRETWAAISKTEDASPLAECNIEYRADTSDPYPGGWPADEAKGNPDAPKWRPSIFMPRWASRITLEVTDVRVQRVNEITWQDVIKEGVPGYTVARGCLSDNPPDARWKFIELWDSINAKRGYGWGTMPWVWALTFRRLQP